MSFEEAMKTAEELGTQHGTIAGAQFYEGVAPDWENTENRLPMFLNGSLHFPDPVHDDFVLDNGEQLNINRELAQALDDNIVYRPEPDENLSYWTVPYDGSLDRVEYLIHLYNYAFNDACGQEVHRRDNLEAPLPPVTQTTRWVTFAMPYDPDRDEIEDWRERVGNGEADIVSDELVD